MLFALDFFIRRIAQGLVLVVLVAMLIFTLLRIVPGDPVRMMLGPMVSASVAEQTAKDMGLRDPIPVQFGRYVAQILTGDFGSSFVRSAQGGSTGGSRGGSTFDADLSIDENEVLGIIGESGSGKTVLARALVRWVTRHTCKRPAGARLPT